jgi:hypothetical protein
MKKYLGGMIAIVIAVTAAAFTNHKENKRPDPYPYYFSFDGNSVGEQADSTNYTLLQGPNFTCQETGTLHCMINANKNGLDYPILRSGVSTVFVEISSKAVE